VSERFAEIESALTLLRDRFQTVIWAPGNHELWTLPDDPVQLRGEARYRRLVEMCRNIGVLTPQDPYPIWNGNGGPATIAPLFVLYDYSFRVAGTTTKEESLRRAYQAEIVCTDEMLLHPDPHQTREDWCWERVAYTERRLAECDPTLPTVLVNHFPLVRQPTDVLRHPEFAQWCGTERTADWHTRSTTGSASKRSHSAIPGNGAGAAHPGPHGRCWSPHDVRSCHDQRGRPLWRRRVTQRLVGG
jgi:3',5'-cyclic AMP phosphodiesterase CpdA